MPDQLQMRRCEGRDEDGYVRLNLEFMDDVKGGSDYWGAIQTPTADQLRRVFREILRMPETMQVFVAELKGEVVAYVNAYTVYSVWSLGKALTIDDLYVDARFRGQGIGRALMEFTEAFAWEQGYKRVQLHAEMKNVGAHRLYLDLGYEAEDMVFFMKRGKGGESWNK